MFDARFPHGVGRVGGTQDISAGRLVVHGWYAEPSPFCHGALAPEQVEPPLAQCMQAIHDALASMPPATGTLSVRLTVNGPTGKVAHVDWLSDTLVPIPGAPVLALDGACVEPPEDARMLILETIVEHIAQAHFPSSEDGDTEVTVPFVFS